MNLPRGLSSRAKKGCKGQSQGCSAFRSLALLSMADICILQIIVFLYLYIQISLHFCVNIFWICICVKVKVALHAVVGGWCFCLNHEILVCLYFHFFLCFICSVFLSKSRLHSVSRGWYLCANNHFRYGAQRSFRTWCKKSTTETMPYKLLGRTWFLLEHNSALPISAISNLFDWIAWTAANFGKL